MPTNVDFSGWPVWLMAVAVILSLVPKTTQGLAVLIPPFAEWMKSRDSKDTQLIARLLGVVEQTLQERAETARDNILALDKLERAINNQTLHIERGNHLFTALNASLTGLSDKVTDLGVKMAYVQGRVAGKDGRDGPGPTHRSYGE